MNIEQLDIPDAWVCTPRQFPDERGVFLEWFRRDVVEKAIGRRFEVVQANHSVSRRGVVRGVHYADTPPGQAKYVYCSRGSVLDFIVDLRVGSPTFGRHTTVRVDDADRCGVFIAEGLGHAFCVLTETADVSYVVSTEYRPHAEHGLDPFCPDLGLPWPIARDELIVSDKDLEAPGLAQAISEGALPSYDACCEWYASLAL